MKNQEKNIRKLLAGASYRVEISSEFRENLYSRLRSEMRCVSSAASPNKNGYVGLFERIRIFLETSFSPGIVFAALIMVIVLPLYTLRVCNDLSVSFSGFSSAPNVLDVDMVGRILHPRQKVKSGSLIRIADNAGALLNIGDRSRILLRSNSSIRLLEARRKNVKMEMLAGEAFFDVTRKKSNEKYAIITPHARIDVVGTVFGVRTDSARTLISVLRGKVMVTDDDSAYSVGAGEKLTLGGIPRKDRMAAAEYSPLVNFTFVMQQGKTPCFISLNSNPSGSELLVDHVVKGRTPAVLELEAGEHLVQIKSMGYQDISQMIIAQHGAKNSFQFKMVPSSGVVSEPRLQPRTVSLLDTVSPLVTDKNNADSILGKVLLDSSLHLQTISPQDSLYLLAINTMMKGDVQYNENMLYRAIELFMQYLTMYPDAPNRSYILLNLAECYKCTRHFVQALKYYSFVEEKTHDYLLKEKAVWGKTNLYSEHFNDKEEALRYLDMYQKLFPAGIFIKQAVFEKIKILEMQQRYMEMDGQYQKLLDFFPANAQDVKHQGIRQEILYKTANLYYKHLQHLDKAMQYYKTYLAEFPLGNYQARVLFEMADCYELSGDIEKTLFCLNQYLQLSPRPIYYAETQRRVADIQAYVERKRSMGVNVLTGR